MVNKRQVVQTGPIQRIHPSSSFLHGLDVLVGPKINARHKPVRRSLALSGWEVDVVVFLARVFQRRLP